VVGPLVGGSRTPCSSTCSTSSSRWATRGEPVTAPPTRASSSARSDGLHVDDLEAELAARVSEWRTLAARNVAQGRQVLRKLLGQHRVVATPKDDGTVEPSGRADYGKVFSGILCRTVASPT